jgi:hypothetical protein
MYLKMKFHIHRSDTSGKMLGVSTGLEKISRVMICTEGFIEKSYYVQSEGL